MKKLQKLKLKELENVLDVINICRQAEIIAGSGGQVGNTCYFECMDFLANNLCVDEDLNSFIADFGSQYGYGGVINGVSPSEVNTFTDDYFLVGDCSSVDSACNSGNFVLTDIYSGIDPNTGVTVTHSIVITGYNSSTGAYSYFDPADESIQTTSDSSLFGCTYIKTIYGSLGIY